MQRSPSERELAKPAGTLRVFDRKRKSVVDSSEDQLFPRNVPEKKGQVRVITIWHLPQEPVVHVTICISYQVVEDDHFLEQHREPSDLVCSQRVLPARFVPFVEDFSCTLVAVDEHLRWHHVARSGCRSSGYLVAPLLRFVVLPSPAPAAVEESGRAQFDYSSLRNNVELKCEW